MDTKRDTITKKDLTLCVTITNQVQMRGEHISQCRVIFKQIQRASAFSWTWIDTVAELESFNSFTTDSIHSYFLSYFTGNHCLYIWKNRGESERSNIDICLYFRDVTVYINVYITIFLIDVFYQMGIQLILRIDDERVNFPSHTCLLCKMKEWMNESLIVRSEKRDSTESTMDY